MLPGTEETHKNSKVAQITEMTAFPVNFILDWVSSWDNVCEMVLRVVEQEETVSVYREWSCPGKNTHGIFHSST